MNKPANPIPSAPDPDEQGMFGIFGGRFVAETLMPLILDLERHWNAGQERSGISGPSSTDLSTHYAGRPSPALFRRSG